MTTTAPDRRSPAVRRVGDVIGAAFNAALLYAANVWPGWETIPFLTEDVEQVIGLVNASIMVSLAANIAYLVRDPRWLKALGDVVTTAVGLAALVRIWQVFPFDFDSGGFDWPLAMRILLGIAIVGSVIGILAGLTAFVRSVTADRPVRR